MKLLCPRDKKHNNFLPKFGVQYNLDELIISPPPEFGSLIHFIRL